MDLNDFDELSKIASEEKNINVQNELLKNIQDLRELVKKMRLNVFCLMKQMYLTVT